MRRRTLVLAICAVAVALVVTLSARQFGSDSAEAQGLNVNVSLSKPANGSFLVAGEKAVVTIALNDKSGATLTRESFATLNLYFYGPQETDKTVTAKFLGADFDRSKTPHHFINLLNNPTVQVSGNVLRYPLQAVTDEEPGTYIAAVWAVSKGVAARENQMFALANVQVGTATVEKQIVAKEKCAACHLGTTNGQFYFHHVDPGRSPFGSPSIDSIPPETCKACHNNNGYAAYPGDINAPALEENPTARTPDPLVRRAHGVHRGRHLESAFNIDPEKGDFKDYLHVEFPADVRNCTACHVDDRFKQKPTRQACGACHDNAWFGELAQMPAGRKLHSGGTQLNDTACAACHPPDTGGVKAVAEAHKVPPPDFKHQVELTMSLPKNGKFFVAGEMPQVGIVIRDRATGQVISPNTIREPADAAKVQPGEFRRANLYVSGTRADTKPVLTPAGARTTTYANNDLRVLRDASKADPRIARSDTKITYQLDDVKGLKPGTYTVFVETLPAAPNIGGWALFSFQVGTETPEKMVAASCKDCHGNTTMHTSYFAVEFNPDICKSCHDNLRQISGKSGWTDSNNGFGAAPLSRRVHGVHFARYIDKPKEVHSHDYSHVIFPQDVRNCTKCHSESNSWAEKATRVACLACHDTDAAIGHAALQTVDRTPNEPFSGQQTETCNVCHGGNRNENPAKLHNISDPYKPPYPREPVR